MLFAIRCYDKPGHLDVRKANRDAHIAMLEDYGDRVVAAPALTLDPAVAVGHSVCVRLARV